MKITIRGCKYDYPYIFVNEVQMPATFIARPANPRVDMGRRIIIEPALPEGGNVLLTADYLCLLYTSPSPRDRHDLVCRLLL